MLYTLVLLLLVVLNVLLCEGNQTHCNRPKRWLRDDVIKTLVLQNEIEKRKQNSKFPNGECSNFYESIVKDSDDISLSKKGGIEDYEVMVHPNSVSYDKGVENEPLMSKFYTFSKETDETKPFNWIDLLSSPIVQSLIKPKDTDVLLKSPRDNKFNIEDIINAKYQGNSKTEIDDATLNNILQYFASSGNKNCNKTSDRETEVKYSNLASSKKDVMDEKLSPSCLVENISNYYKTSQGPHSKVESGPSAMELCGRVNAALGNSNKGRFEKTNNILGNNLSSANKGYIKDSDVSTLSHYPTMIGQYSSFHWPDMRNHRLNIYNFSKTSPAMDRGNMPQKSISKTKNNNYFDILGDIILDEPGINASSSNSNSQNVKLISNVTYLKNNYSSYSSEVPPSLQRGTTSNDVKINSSGLKNNLNHANLQNLINSPATIEKICLLNKIISSNKFNNLNKCNISGGSSGLFPLDQHSIKYNGIDNKSDMRTLSNYILSHKTLNSGKIKPENKTVFHPTDADLKLNFSNINSANVGLRSDLGINKTIPAIISIGEQMPNDIKPGTQKIILPEYEKMEDVEDFTQYPQLMIGSTEIKYEPISTTAALPIENELETSELPLIPHTDPINSLHRNMLPVIDFLGQMWNNSNRKNQGLSLKNFETEIGGYVIVPLPEIMPEKTPAVGKHSKFRDSEIVSAFSNDSISQLMTSTNRDLLEEFILKRLFDSFRESLVPKKRARRSKPIVEDVEDSHSPDFSSTTTVPNNATQLPPTDKWTMNSSVRPGYSNTSSVCQ